MATIIPTHGLRIARHTTILPVTNADGHREHAVATTDIFQQAWMNLDTGATEWRNIPIVEVAEIPPNAQ